MTALRQSLQVFVDRELSPAAQSARLATVARNTLADLLSSGRASPRYATYVDGRPGDESEAQRVVLYEFQYIGDAVVAAVAYLRTRSAPEVSGTFAESFMVAVNGRAIPARAVNPQSIPGDAEVMIYNTQPYARKLDTNRVGSRALKYRTPEGLFDDAARTIRRQFGNTVSAERIVTVRFPGQYTTRRAQVAMRANGRTRTTPPGRLVDSPALVIRARG